LESLKRQLENPRRRKRYDREDIEERLKKIIKGQFIEDILRYNIIELQEGYSFTYYLDEEAFGVLKKEVLGRKIIVTNRHDWNTEEILKAYRGQSNVEFAFRHLKNSLSPDSTSSVSLDRSEDTGSRLHLYTGLSVNHGSICKRRKTNQLQKKSSALSAGLRKDTISLSPAG